MTVLRDGELYLYGFVGDDFWDDGFTASEVMDALVAVGHDADITVHINSGGGFTDDGVAIFNALKAHKGAVAVVIDAIAASAASVIAMAGDTITMRQGALMMIHDPARMTWGDAAAHEKSKAQLDKLADLLADIYADRTGEDPADIREDMKAEIWLNGEEAVERGFATDTEGGRSKAVAAFDYRAYANAPDRLVALAKRESWSLQAEATRKAASVAPTQAHEEETPDMATKTPADKKPVDPAPVNAGDVKARIKAITGHEAAADRPKLAEHLAFDTDMTVEEAAAVLEAAGADSAPVASSGAPEDDGPAPDPAGYQAERANASALAQPGGQKPAKPVAAAPNTKSIYASRKAAANKGA